MACNTAVGAASDLEELHMIASNVRGRSCSSSSGESSWTSLGSIIKPSSFFPALCSGSGLLYPLAVSQFRDIPILRIIAMGFFPETERTSWSESAFFRSRAWGGGSSRTMNCLDRHERCNFLLSLIAEQLRRNETRNASTASLTL